MTFNLRLQMHFERQPPETGFEVSFSDIVRYVDHLLKQIQDLFAHFPLLGKLLFDSASLPQ